MHDLNAKLAELRALVHAARQEAERLEAAIRRAEAIGIDAPRGTLARLQAVADPAALADEKQLSAVAAKLPSRPHGVVADLFADNERTVTLARLAGEGHSAEEIARRLGMAVGEVEIWLGCRPS